MRDMSQFCPGLSITYMMVQLEFMDITARLTIVYCRFQLFLQVFLQVEHGFLQQKVLLLSDKGVGNPKLMLT